MISNSVPGQLIFTGMNQKTALIERNLRKSMIEQGHLLVFLNVFSHCLLDLQGTALIEYKPAVYDARER